MNRQTKFAASLLLMAAVQMVDAASYHVSASFADGGMQRETLFEGSFDWDGAVLANFTGLLSESKWGWNTGSSAFRLGGMKGGMTVTPPYTGNIYAKPGGYSADQAPLLNLVHQLQSGTDPVTGLVTVTTFLQDSNDVVWGGGYDTAAMNGGFAYGASAYAGWDGNTRNFNAFFTLVFDPANPTDTTVVANRIAYADCSALGLVGGMLTGNMCSTGAAGGGTMGGQPNSLEITRVASQAAAVPAPSAAWLFLGCLFSLFGFRGAKPIINGSNR